MRTSMYRRAEYHQSVIDRIISQLIAGNDTPPAAALLGNDVGTADSLGFTVNDLHYFRNLNADRIAKGEAHLAFLDGEAKVLMSEVQKLQKFLGGKTNAQLKRLYDDAEYLVTRRREDTAKLSAVRELVTILDTEIEYRSRPVVVPVVAVIQPEPLRQRTNRKVHKTNLQPRCETTLKSFDELESMLVAMHANERTSIAA